jgi:hypothetical protein
MKKIIRLTENDLSRIVKRIIKEEETQNKIAAEVDDVLEKPKVQDRIEDIYSNFTDRDIENIKRVLDNLGIDEYSSAKEVHTAIEKKIGDKIGGEIGENESLRNKASEILHGIGAANISAWGGVPAAIGIGGILAGTVGAPFAAGLAVSWGVTALLMGIAKLLKEDPPTEPSDFNNRNKQNGPLRKMRPDNSYEDEPEIDLIKNRSLSVGKDGDIFTRTASGEKIYHEKMKGDDLPKGYKRTMDENYRRRQYKRRY